MVVDDQPAFMKSLNWKTRNLTATRDYAVVTSHGHEVNEVIESFDAEWERAAFRPGGLSEICPSRRSDRLLEGLERAGTTGSEIEVEGRMRDKNDRYRWFLHQLFPLHDAAGNTTHWCGTRIDIEDRKNAQESTQEKTWIYE